ncbi:MAG: RecX family transcriptional regulator [Calditrichaeota bacterium]|nr:RecX family transcriptional regulator [Calditrichota bacterium]
MLAHRALTRREVNGRLKAGGVSPEAARETILELVADGYIDERAIAEDAVRLGRSERLVGRFLLRHELTRRGIPEQLVEEVLTRDYPNVSEPDVARKFVERRLRTSSGGSLLRETLLRRVAGALERRGFAGETIGIVMSEVSRTLNAVD